MKDLGGISMAENDKPKPTTEQSHPVNDREDKYKVDWAKIDAMTDYHLPHEMKQRMAIGKHGTNVGLL